MHGIVHFRSESEADLGRHSLSVKVGSRVPSPELVAATLSLPEFQLGDNWIILTAATFGEVRLAAELSELAPLMEAAGLDFSLTGYEMSEIDRLLGDHCDPEANPADAPVPISKAAVSRVDHLWQLGGHRTYCGDSRHSSSFKALMLTFPQSRTADQVDSINQALAYKFSTYTLDYVS